MGDYRSVSKFTAFPGGLAKLSKSSEFGRIWENDTHYLFFARNTGGSGHIYLISYSKEGHFEFETAVDFLDSMDGEVTSITEFTVGTSTIQVSYD